jgi:enamine deaminase RidA (YjgF/YER057c/UK114 family)
MIPNSPLIQCGETIYLGGTPPLDDKGTLVGPGDVGAQTKAIVRRMEALLGQHGCELGNIAFMTVYLSSMDDYEAMNAAYTECLPSPYPARKVVQTPLTLEGMRVEMTAIASTLPRATPTGGVNAHR